MSLNSTNQSPLHTYANEYNASLKKLANIYAFKKKGTFEEEQILRNNRRIKLPTPWQENKSVKQTGFRKRRLINSKAASRISKNQNFTSH